MSVSDGQAVDAATTNAAFMSRTSDTSTTGKITQSDTTESTDKDTGAIVTEGGVGIEKNLNVGGNATIEGDLTVNGATTTVNTSTLDVEDKNIEMNVGGSDATSEGAGITVHRDGTDGSIVYEDALTAKFKVGALGSEVEIQDVSSAQTVTNKTINSSVIDADNNTISNLAHGAEVDDPSSDVHGVTGDVVGTTDTQSLTNKTITSSTIDGDLNTISNLAHGAEVDDPSSGVHGVTSDVVGTTDTQGLSNKTLTSCTIDGDLNTIQDIGDGALSESYVKADGTRPLTANWDAGAFSIEANSVKVGESAGRIDTDDSASGAASQALTSETGANTSSGASGDYTARSGTTNTGASGSAFYGSGNSSNGSTGLVSNQSGDVTTGSGNSGDYFLESGSADSGNSGGITIRSGASTSGDSGNINLTTSSAGGTRGDIVMNAQQIRFTSHRLQDVADPASAQDAATKNYVDGTANHVGIYDGSGEPSSEAQLAISRGGTGESTASAAFDALAPTTTKGDLVAYSTTNARLGVGTNGQVLTADSTQATGMKWDDPSGSGAGGINFIDDGDRDAETDTGTWAAYEDTGDGSPDDTRPADGTGGSVLGITLSRTITASELINGDGSFKVAKDGFSRQGEGVSVDFTIDRGYVVRPVMQQIRFQYDVSANFAFNGGIAGDESDIMVWIYDVDNAELIQPAPYGLDGSGEFVAEFQPNQKSASGGNYRLILHVATTNASAWDFFFDDVVVGPSPIAKGAPVSDWEDFTPTGSWTTNTTYAGRWRRVASSIEVENWITLSGTPTTATLTVNLPSGRTIETADLPGGTNTNQRVGDANILDVSLTNYPGQVLYNSTTSVRVNYFNDPASGAQPIRSANVTQSAPIGAPASGDAIYVKYKVPIVGWSSNTIMSDDASTRLVFARVSGATTSISTDTRIDFSTVEADTHGRVTTGGSWEYEAPVSGEYEIEGFLSTVSVAWSAGHRVEYKVFKNGTYEKTIGFQRFDAALSTSSNENIAGQVSLQAGDTIYFTGSSNVSVALDGVDERTYVSISRKSGPAQIAASEKVHEHYTTVSNSVPTGTQHIDYGTKVDSTHNSVTTGSGWVWTAPRSGFAMIDARVRFLDSFDLDETETMDLVLHKNGSEYRELDHKEIESNVTLGLSLTGGLSVQVQAGDTFHIEVVNNSGATLTLRANAEENWFTVLMP